MIRRKYNFWDAFAYIKTYQDFIHKKIVEFEYLIDKTF